MFDSPLEFFALEVPIWLLFITVAVFAWLHVGVVRRLDNHARSIGNMDDWANKLENELDPYSLFPRLKRNVARPRYYDTGDPHIWH